jgi:2-polyprenyl-3-methyl-5-hydroxy-6-metoxy-1,4-benzoquinol methylase
MQEAITQKPEASTDSARRDAFVGRVFGAAVQAVDLFAIYLGSRLGYYEALARHGPLTSKRLAARTKTAERYAREWLEQQAVAGILDVAGGPKPAERRFALPPGHAEVLLDQTSTSYLAFFPRYFIASAQVMPKLLRAYRTGGGVAWGAYGADVWEAQAEQNRPFLTTQFVPSFVAKIPEVHRRLKRKGARIADIACGAGWASIALAQAYPHARVDGFDLDASALRQARKNARDAGVGDRVKFHLRDAATAAADEPYDFATIVEAVHDLSRPVDVLRAARRLLAPTGSLLVVDENVPEEFAAPGSDLDRLFYGFSLLACLPNGLADKPSAATGTVMRPATLREYARKAGFASTEVLALPHDFFRFYLLRP